MRCSAAVFSARWGFEGGGRVESQVRILIIEDDPLIQSIMETLLRGAFQPSARCRIYSTLAAGRVALQSAQWNLVVLDISLPDSPDIGTYDEIAAIAEVKRVPVLVC